MVTNPTLFPVWKWVPRFHMLSLKEIVNEETTKETSSPTLLPLKTIASTTKDLELVLWVIHFQRWTWLTQWNKWILCMNNAHPVNGSQFEVYYNSFVSFCFLSLNSININNKQYYFENKVLFEKRSWSNSSSVLSLNT